MVINPTYCKINGALITYKQMRRINHKQHKHDSPTNMTLIKTISALNTGWQMTRINSK